MSVFMVYFILMLDHISITLAFVLVALVVTIIYLINSETQRDYSNYDLYPKAVKRLKRCIYGAAVICLLLCFLPGTNQMCAIYILPKISKNKGLSKLPEKITKFANIYLDNKIKSLTKESGNG